ncbi:MAG: hypothetical protein J7M25_14720, partial [Deltaproteobacteria bacterium]|nr:hypothetical protein [Deltaproteobacteria bacterium]
TDAWFEGRGPDLAERGRTKEGLRNRHKVGILLLCNEHGYPLRWKTLAGRTKAPQALRELVGGIEAEPWARDVPIVFDRAMGTAGAAGAVAKLWLSGLRFVTAVHPPRDRERHRRRAEREFCGDGRRRGGRDRIAHPAPPRRLRQAGPLPSSASHTAAKAKLYRHGRLKRWNYKWLRSVVVKMGLDTPSRSSSLAVTMSGEMFTARPPPWPRTKTRTRDASSQRCGRARGPKRIGRLL